MILSVRSQAALRKGYPWNRCGVCRDGLGRESAWRRRKVEIGTRTSATSFGGIGAVRPLVGKLGLPQEIDGRLNLLKRHLPYFESDHVLNIAYNLLCGGHAAR